jgi:hypothetical protein
MNARYHSIIGDRGKGDSPNSTDELVPYWNSNLNGAKSELIVPSPHGSESLPQTIAELQGIMRSQLKSSETSRAVIAQPSYWASYSKMP